MNNRVILGALVGVGVYLLSKRNTPVPIVDNNIIVPVITPTVILPTPSDVVNPNPIVVDPINSPTIQYGTTIIEEDYNVPNIQSLAQKGWDLWENIPGSLDYTGGCLPQYCSMDIAQTIGPKGSMINALRMIYPTANCPPGITSTNQCDDSTNARLIKHFANVPEIFVRVYQKYDPIDPSKPSSFIDQYNPSAKMFVWNVGQINQVIFEYLYSETASASPCLITETAATNVYCVTRGEARDACPLVPNKTVVNLGIGNGKWYCVEYQMKMQSSQAARDGIARIWIDGILTTEYTNMLYGNDPSLGFNSLIVYRQGMINVYRYEKDFVVATQRIGP